MFFCDIRCLALAGGIVFVLHFHFQFGVYFFYGGMFGRCLCSLYFKDMLSCLLLACYQGCLHVGMCGVMFENNQVTN